MNPKVDAFLSREKKWQAEMEAMRAIALDCKLTEELKWGVPCYTLDNVNVVLIHGFKEYCAYLFMKGALLDDPKGLLVQQTENVQSSRQIRFAKLQEITKLKAVLKSYIKQAIAVEKAGLKVIKKTTQEFPVPEEFQIQLDQRPLLKKAFAKLTPGRQRAYLLHFAAAKQAKTREARVAKCAAQILEGKGLNDE